MSEPQKQPTRVQKQLTRLSTHAARLPRWFLWAVWFVFAFFFTNALVGLILAFLPEAVIDFFRSPLGTGVLTAIVDLLLIAVIIGAPAFFKKNRILPTREGLGLDGLPTWVDILLGIGGLITYFLFATATTWLLQQLLPNLDWGAAQELGGFKLLFNGVDFFAAFITLVLVAPILEEFLFRGFLYAKLRRSLPWWSAALIVSLIFSIAHGQWNVGVAVFGLSFVACGLRELTGTIYAGIILHVLKNALAFYLLYGGGFLAQPT